MDTEPFKPRGTYLQYLPEILQEQEFLDRFLLAFESVLSGVEDGNQEPYNPPILTNISEEEEEEEDKKKPIGIEKVLDRVHDYFDPEKTPEEFLPWLAGWVDLSLRDDWTVEFKRAFILQAIPLYRSRGTIEGLKNVLAIYLEKSNYLSANKTIADKQIECNDEFIHYPNYFQVRLTLNTREPTDYWNQVSVARGIIDREKPAHTYYALKILSPTMRITEWNAIAKLSIDREKIDRIRHLIKEQQGQIRLKIIIGFPDNGNDQANIQIQIGNIRLKKPSEQTDNSTEIEFYHVLSGNDFIELIDQLNPFEILIKGNSLQRISAQVKVSIDRGDISSESEINERLLLTEITLSTLSSIYSRKNRPYSTDVLQIYQREEGRLNSQNHTTQNVTFLGTTTSDLQPFPLNGN